MKVEFPDRESSKCRGPKSRMSFEASGAKTWGWNIVDEHVGGRGGSNQTKEFVLYCVFSGQQ